MDVLDIMVKTVFMAFIIGGFMSGISIIISKEVHYDITR